MLKRTASKITNYLNITKVLGLVLNKIIKQILISQRKLLNEPLILSHMIISFPLQHPLENFSQYYAYTYSCPCFYNFCISQQRDPEDP